MSVMMTPPLDRKPWPSLGASVAKWMEDNLVHGPGDLRGEPYRLDAEKTALVYRIYEVYPKGHAMEGRRRFRRVGISLRKGSAKSEFAAALVAVELAPDGPVRTRDWARIGREWRPVGGPVTDPYIPMIAYTEEQSDELVYGALMVMVTEGPLADIFDSGKERIMRLGGDGKAVSLATAPDARDGARTTFQVFDETHRLVLPRHRETHRTMMANLPKRRASDPWALEITTAPTPGEGSIAESTMDYARAVADGAQTDSRLFFFHRQASDAHDLTVRKGVKAAVLEASGPVAEWSDIEAIVDQWEDPTADRAYLERVWLNRLVRSAEQAFDLEQWKTLAKPEYAVERGADVTIGVDGSRYEDSTAIVATEVITGHQWLAGLWEKPLRSADRWEVPRDEVHAAIGALFDTYQVWRLYADPAYWQGELSEWAAMYGTERIVMRWMNERLKTARATRSFAVAIMGGDLSHSGDERLTRHIGATHRIDLPQRDDDGTPLWITGKERKDSPHKKDAADAAVLSWEARTHAIAEGVGQMVWSAV